MPAAVVDRDAAIDTIVRAAVERQELPGLSVIVAHGGDAVFAGGYGKRNLGEGLPADPDTIYSIASVSKQFTVAALMQLAERGALRVDDPVKRYFPWLKCDERTQVRHLLSHTSGIRDYFPLEDLDRIGFTPATPREIAESVSSKGTAFAPGAEYQYCNTGYVLLGALIERVAETSYAQYLQANIFEPLGLTRTGVDDMPAIHSNLAVGYTSFALSPWELARDYHPSWEFATGGLYSTVNDMLRWNRALRGGRVVHPESLAQMTTPMVLSNGHAVNYGFGLGLTSIDGIREVRHTGGLPGMSTDNATFPELDIDIIVFVNADSCSTYATITRPILALLQADPRLVGTRTRDTQASSGLAERPQLQTWIRALAGGALDRVPLSPRLARQLRLDQRAQLSGLRAFGDITAIRLIDANRRDPETTFSYRVDFAGGGPLAATITIRDDDTLAAFNFIRWDDRG